MGFVVHKRVVRRQISAAIGKVFIQDRELPFGFRPHPVINLRRILMAVTIRE